MRATYGVEEVHPCGKNGNFTLQKNNICNVIGNLSLKNCYYYPKSTIKFWKVMEFCSEVVNIEVHIIFS